MVRPRSRRSTSKDVAELAGVSRATVSYVINDKKGGTIRVSDSTRLKVLEAVEQLNYHPVRAAQALKTKRSNLLALVIPHIDTAFQPQFAAAVQREAEMEGMDITIRATRDEPERERDFVDSLISRGVDGAIIHSHHPSNEHIESLVDAGIAVVIHGNSPNYAFADNVMIDEIGAATEAVSYLIKQGHRRIGLITGPNSTWDGHLRRQGYLNALVEGEIALADDLIFEVDFFSEKGSREAMAQLLAMPEPPTAVFSASDLLAIEAMLYAVDAGLSVPDDVAIVGFDNTREAKMVRPRLTTVHKDVHLIASTAVRLLCERINGESVLPSRQITLEHRLILRESA